MGTVPKQIRDVEWFAEFDNSILGGFCVPDRSYSRKALLGATPAALAKWSCSLAVNAMSHRLPRAWCWGVR